MDKSYTDTTWLRLNRPSCIYAPINAQIVCQARSILTIIVMETFHFQWLIMAGQPLCIRDQCHNIAQLRAIKVLLRHLERRYTAKRYNNHVDSTNGNKAFFRQNSPTCLSHLLTLALEECTRTNQLGSLLCRNYNRLHLELLGS